MLNSNASEIDKTLALTENITENITTHNVIQTVENENLKVRLNKNHVLVVNKEN